MKKNNGFTLIELVITLGILSILIIPLSNFFIRATITNRMSDEKMEATMLAQRLMEGIKSLEEVNEENLKDMFYDVRFDYNIDNLSRGSFTPSREYNLLADINIIENIFSFETSNDYYNNIKNNPHIIVKEIENNKFKVILKGYNPPIFGPHDYVRIVEGDRLELRLERQNNNKGTLYINDFPYFNNVDLNKVNEDTLNLLTDTNKVDVINNVSYILFNTANSNDYTNDSLRLYDISIVIYKNEEKNNEIENFRGSLIKND